MWIETPPPRETRKVMQICNFLGFSNVGISNLYQSHWNVSLMMAPDAEVDIEMDNGRTLLKSRQTSNCRDEGFKQLCCSNNANGLNNTPLSVSLSNHYQASPNTVFKLEVRAQISKFILATRHP
jgi:hypothetical protein